MLLASTFRVAPIAFAVAVLAACSGGNAVVPQERDAAAATAAAGEGTTSPCDISGFWYFHGSCQTFYVNPKGMTVRLAAYRGLKLQESFSNNFAKKKDTFVAGEGTGETDITGSVRGVTFPVYGSVGCTNFSGTKLPCPGKAVLYNVIENASSETIAFNATPAFSITNTGSFSGKECQVIQLHPTGSGYVWIRLDIFDRHVTPHALTFRPFTSFVVFAPKSKGVFGFICY